jgi:predicted MFS family arabinose efflux permease
MGIVISGIIGILLAVLLPQSAIDGWGWRIPFLFGSLIAPVGLYLRRRLRDTFRREEAPASMSDVLTRLLRHESVAILQGIVAISGLTVSSYFFLYVAAFATTELHYSQQMAMVSNLAVGITGTIFTPLGGILADRYGTTRLALIPRIAMVVLIFPALNLALAVNSPIVLFIVVSGLMALNSLSAAAPIVLMLKIFSPALRTTGLSIAAALGITLFGGTAQIVFTGIIGATGERLSFVWYVIGMNLISIAAMVMVSGYSPRGQFSLPAPDGR